MKAIILLLGILLPIIGTSQTTAPLKVSITDFQKKMLRGEQVLFINQVTKKTFKGVSDDKGRFLINLPVGKYDIKLKSIGDSQDYSTLEIPKIEDNQAYSEMTMQIMISTPKFFTLDNLHFASSKATILKSSYTELAELIEYLKLKPNLRIEISGHTDSDGNEMANLELSNKRSQAVRNYLIKNGIKANRLFAIGYGETKPIADNSTSVGKAKNRRTEVKVL
jgi:OOP family OmpA-OmpF porin